jgi:CDP-glycerol glycerophosphotransferase (TagB/SpsB family)
MYIRNEIASDSPEIRIEEFKKTVYYQFWNELLHNERLLSLIREQNLELVFYPHREMHPFLEAFAMKGLRVKIASWPEYDVQELLKSSALLVTDFSSVSMDFAYMKKPVIYYQFDEEDFYASHHERGYFKFGTDGFGPVCRNADAVVREIESYAACGFANREEYLKRHAEYFDLWDNKNCQRTYEEIKNL